jgi:putative ABC transport system permease protein
VPRSATPVGIGESRLRMGAILSNEPDRGGALFALAPRVMLNQSDLAATGLITEASRAEHRFWSPGRQSLRRAVQKGHRGRLPVNIDLIDGSTARPEFESAVDRASRFLHLATLVTLLVAGAPSRWPAVGSSSARPTPSP